MTPQALKAALPRTWSALFARHGHFTAAQLAAIPRLLAGESLLLVAPTASGKTEAALAPLIERYLVPGPDPPGLTLLYLLPTRALIADLAGRLAAPLDALRVPVAQRTYDDNTFDPRRPAALLLTTPESLDALLAREARALAGVRAVVIDELHIFDGTVRGDQLRVLLARLRAVRAHAARVGDASDSTLQGVALSATVAGAAAVIRRYFAGAGVAEVPGGRPIRAEMLALDEDAPGALTAFLAGVGARGWRKVLAFCNTRREVEEYAAAVRARPSPFGGAIYTHYSNLAWEARRETEEGFARAPAALCFASSTLELGIDIGTVDAVLLIGPPGNRAAFQQRVGRGGRRRGWSAAVCAWRTPLERALFAALLSDSPLPSQPAPFRPSVAVQQIFSLLLQSPGGAVRLNPLAELFAGLLTPGEVTMILGHLAGRGYLQAGRPGEWRAGPRLHDLVDGQAGGRAPLGLHSNLTQERRPLPVLDQASGRLLAHVDRTWSQQEVMTVGGRPLRVAWVERGALWVTPEAGAAPAPHLPYRAAAPVLSYATARLLPAQLGLNPGEAPLVEGPHGPLLFHWLGDVWGRAALDLWRYTERAEASARPSLALLLRDVPAALPIWTEEQVERYVRDHYGRYEPLLALGAYQHLVPPLLRQHAVVAAFDVLGFLQAVGALVLEKTPTPAADLRTLLW